MRIAGFDEAGPTGRQLIREALDRGHEVVAFARSPSKLNVDDSASTVVERDADAGARVSEPFEDPDGVVSVLGGTETGPGDSSTVAERHARRVRATDLAWTVVGVPRLNDGDYRAGDVDVWVESIACACLATFECLEDDLYVRDMPKVGPA
jgi:uncharacterized protein YbjT (DUF2867 family)